MKSFRMPHDSEPEEDFASFFSIEEGLIIFIDNPVRVNFSGNMLVTESGIGLLKCCSEAKFQRQGLEIYFKLSVERIHPM